MSKLGSAPSPVALGLRALRGGAVIVGVAVEADQPRVVLSSFIATAIEVAAEFKRGTDGNASIEAVTAVTEGRKRQDQLAAKGLINIVGKLRHARYDPVVAALLVNRASWIADLLEYSLFAPEHPAVAEGLAVRDALRFAFLRVSVAAVELA